MDENYRDLARLLRMAADAIDQLADEAARLKFLLANTPEQSGIDLPVWDIPEMKPRMRKACLRLGTKTLRHLATFTETDVLMAKNCGTVTLFDLKNVLEKYGLKFREELKT